MTKAELESKPLSDLHSLAAEAGVEKFRMLTKGELAERLADGDGGGSDSGSGGGGSRSGGRSRSGSGSGSGSRSRSGGRSGGGGRSSSGGGAPASAAKDDDEDGERPVRRRRRRRRPDGGADEDASDREAEGEAPSRAREREQGGEREREKGGDRDRKDAKSDSEDSAPSPSGEADTSESTRPRRRRRRRFGRRGKGEVTIQSLLLPPEPGRQAVLYGESREACTDLLRGVAADIAADAKGPDPIALLIDPSPEELADWRREAPQAEIVAAGQPRHASDALAQAARRAGSGEDVFLLIDSLSRLAEASGDADAAKEFFDAGREGAGSGGGSLTVVAALEKPSA